MSGMLSHSYSNFGVTQDGLEKTMIFEFVSQGEVRDHRQKQGCFDQQLRQFMKLNCC